MDAIEKAADTIREENRKKMMELASIRDGKESVTTSLNQPIETALTEASQDGNLYLVLEP